MVNLSHNREAIFQLLSQIVDPEIPVVTIQEMGMLRDVVVSENTCEVIITPTYTACPAMGIIEDDIKTILNENGVENITVSLVYSPAWTTDLMTEATKEKLKKYGIAAPLHSACSTWMSTAERVTCPRCHSQHTRLISKFGSTACKALYSCEDCLEPFDYFKCH